MKYTPIALQYVHNDTIHASSGVYISSNPTTSSSSSSFILTINHIPRIGDYSIYANSNNDNSSPKQINWHRVSVIEEVAINTSNFELFDNRQFDLFPRDQYGKTLSILKLSSPPVITSTLMTSVTATSSVSIGKKSAASVSVGDPVTIISSPFNFTNSLIFHKFITTARIVYQIHSSHNDFDSDDGTGDYWLTDAPYMENMAGGAVIQRASTNTTNSSASVKVNSNTNTKNSNSTNTYGPSNKLVGLVLGNLRKINGDGNLMVIIPLSTITQLSPTLIPPPPPPLAASVVKSPSSILYKTISSTTLSKLFNLPLLSKTNAGQNKVKSVLPIIINASNQRTWGSCIFYKEQTLITNSHVVTPLFQNQSNIDFNTDTNSRRSTSFDNNATILINNQGDSIQISAIAESIIIPHPDLDLAFIQIDKIASASLIQNGFHPITFPPSSGNVVIEDPVYTVSFGLFLDPWHLQPLTSHGIINCIYRSGGGQLDQKQKQKQGGDDADDSSAVRGTAGLIIASASCFNGSSGGALFTSGSNELIGMICSNAKVYKPKPYPKPHSQGHEHPQPQEQKEHHKSGMLTSGKDTEKLTTFTFVLPIDLIEYCYNQVYHNKPKVEAISNNEAGNGLSPNEGAILVDVDSKIVDLWKLKPFHKDVYIGPSSHVNEKAKL
ncbi:hypothetical protein CANMA_001114 [Candida margitis]|uniref:uncharacterized protein n=1 Tax=Candida margitis TaxID=1775924 RepID=UPI002227BD26|nr:uncharacterized protein CANMA_001114 [Candida margitis]KAI5969824.1 hypothetical protein CANMA_001114 [Candida margitis]